MAGCQKHNTGAMILAGQTYNMPVDLVNEIQNDLNVTDDATQAHGAWMAKVAVMRQSHKALDPVLSLFKRRVVSEVGNTQEAQGILADYGWTSQKQPKRKVAQKMAAVQKGQGTRKLRNTMGSKQKQNVKAGGTAPNAPVPAEAPAPTNASASAPANSGNGNGATQKPAPTSGA
jgi:hypothetical protein